MNFLGLTKEKIYQMVECPHGDFLAEFFAHKFRDVPKVIQGIELGVRSAQDAAILLARLPVTIIGVDNYLPYIDVQAEITEEMQAKVKGHAIQLQKEYPDRFSLDFRDSIEAASKYPDKAYDFVFIDANHSYAEVKKDLLAWYNKVKPGGVYCGHDYSMDGVKAATTQFFSFTGHTLNNHKDPAVDVWWVNL